MEGSVDVAQESFGTGSEGGKKDEKNACNWVLLNIKVKFFLMLRREIRFFERLNKSSQRCQKHVFC